jgi:hypothetical protein
VSLGPRRVERRHAHPDAYTRAGSLRGEVADQYASEDKPTKGSAGTRSTHPAFSPLKAQPIRDRTHPEAVEQHGELADRRQSPIGVPEVRPRAPVHGGHEACASSQ